ncbi:hypothetical protein E4K67_22660 [Desulfosporosinus fructosivorans]|uniref:Uncharacterized protein n=1 Tax=Desulfosporosinus fructosivorans TaxID=2018669 RepID=A0A4Z0QYN9_9FIRM|nr:hypothetical protein [Desulfosporosinus fructosivorans]TGE35921.1 hypothetical protein E4K67_22660 [Desulfosporosinus fructosivorans]
MLKTIRKILLKIDCIERAASAHQTQQSEKRYHEHWAQLMRSGNTIREEDKSAEDHVDHQVFIDSVNWGGM